MRYLALLMVLLVAVLSGCGDGERSVGPVQESAALKGLSVEEADSTDAAAQARLSARAELADRGIVYTREAFLDSARAGNLAVVKLFVAGGMSVEVADHNGETALVWAARVGDVAMVRYLVGQGAEYITIPGVNVKETLLHIAARSGSAEMVRFLIEHGADVTVWGGDGSTLLLHLAAESGSAEMVRYLIEEQGLDVRAKDRGRTALHYAARSGHLLVVKYLVGAGADVTATNNEGETARDWAIARFKTEVAEYLESVGG